MRKLIDILGTIGVIIMVIGLPMYLFIDVPKSLLTLSLILMGITIIYDEIYSFRTWRDSI